jgi:hypothetical protein
MPLESAVAGRDRIELVPLGNPWDIPDVDLTSLSPEEHAWVIANEARWRRAYAIVQRNPGLDPGDVYHVLCTYHETPTERVRRSLSHGRLRATSR